MRILICALLGVSLATAGIVYAQQHIGGQLRDAALENRMGDPASGNIEGRIYWHASQNKMKVYNGATYEDVGDVSGPGLAVGNAIVKFNGTTGKVVESTDIQLPSNGTSVQSYVLRAVLVSGGQTFMDWQSPNLLNKETGAPACTEGLTFYNDTSDYLCFCDATATPKQVQNPASNCF